MKLIIAGGRTFNDYKLLETETLIFVKQINATEIVSGCASGADYMGLIFGENYLFDIKKFRADWHTFGKSAGPKRNEQMAKYADALIAFWDGQSRGTADMIDRANAYGLIVKIIRYDN